MLDQPDLHMDPDVAARYDENHADHFEPDLLRRTVGVLAELAAGGAAVEFAIGTGRIAVPLVEAGVHVHGIDASEPMVAALEAKPGAEEIEVVIGDMTTATAGERFSLAYLLFNTIMNVRTLDGQTAVFANAARHLHARGCFVIEVMVPELRLLPPGETIRPFDVSPEHLGFDEYVDLEQQILVSHHYRIDGDQMRQAALPMRYVWPAELDLMARLAGMELESRWADWDRAPFTGESIGHVSVWRKQ